MDAQGINIPELARRAGLNVTTVYRWFDGRMTRGLTQQTLEKLMAVLNLRIADEARPDMATT
jgi:AcrR family transcriptional regulator